LSQNDNGLSAQFPRTKQIIHNYTTMDKLIKNISVVKIIFEDGVDDDSVDFVCVSGRVLGGI
jgi:hypothetical protein